MSFLLDTNVLSELARPRPDRGVEVWAQSHFWVNLSCIVVEELSFGLAWKPNFRVQKWLEGFLDERCEILPITVEIARAAGILRGQLQAAGETRAQSDILIAATAAHHGLTLVTRNTADFQGCGINLLNPFR